MSIRDLFAMSRQSGPATVTEFSGSDTGSGVRRYVTPARSPYEARRLTTEEKLCILTQTGSWPEDFTAPAYCGLQPGDGYANPREASPLALTGIMDGYVDPTGQSGGSDAGFGTGVDPRDPMRPMGAMRTEGLGSVITDD